MIWIANALYIKITIGQGLLKNGKVQLELTELQKLKSMQSVGDR
jgi:hypothetical protein